MDSKTLTTYMMFTLNNKGFKRILGPFFLNEKERIKKMFPQNSLLHLLEETAFASKYPQCYYEHIQYAWIDKVSCYMFHHKSWIGDIKLSANERCITGDYFGLFEMADNSGNLTLQLNLSINSNSFFGARLFQDLCDMDILPIVRGTKYYLDSTGAIYTTWPLCRMLGDIQINESNLN
jgi:hypothetical protein